MDWALFCFLAWAKILLSFRQENSTLVQVSNNLAKLCFWSWRKPGQAHAHCWSTHIIGMQYSEEFRIGDKLDRRWLQQQGDFLWVHRRKWPFSPQIWKRWSKSTERIEIVISNTVLFSVYQQHTHLYLHSRSGLFLIVIWLGVSDLTRSHITLCMSGKNYYF